MNFDYTDEQNALRDSLSKWAAQQYDFEKRKAALKSEDGWKKNWATFAELGLLAAPLPEEYGGLGGGATEVAVVAEEFGKALVVEPFVPTVVLGAGALKYAGNAAQKEEHLNAIAAGERVIAFAQAEPKSRWALNDVSTTAKKSGAGYTLNGQKAVVLGAPHADRLLVQRGDFVAKGQVIGYAGQTGDVSRPQLHFEIRANTTPVNPRAYLTTQQTPS